MATILSYVRPLFCFTCFIIASCILGIVDPTDMYSQRQHSVLRTIRDESADYLMSSSYKSAGACGTTQLVPPSLHYSSPKSSLPSRNTLCHRNQLMLRILRMVHSSHGCPPNPQYGLHYIQGRVFYRSYTSSEVSITLVRYHLLLVLNLNWSLSELPIGQRGDRELPKASS